VEECQVDGFAGACHHLLGLLAGRLWMRFAWYVDLRFFPSLL
jgi:hypothetical protein